MLSPDIWKEQALRANLRVGMRRRFGHDCGAGDVVLVTAETDGLSAYCFRCNDGDFIPSELSFQDKVKNLQDKVRSSAEFTVCQLPFDYTLDVPEKHAVWFYKASIRKAQARELGIGWSPSMQRIIIPVYADDGSLAFMQARAVLPGQIKYINSKGAAAGKTLYQTHRINAETPFVVVTEDMLSAVRCGVYGHAAALCGVAASPTKMLILCQAKQILLWLDPDAAGNTAMMKLRRSLGVMHGDVRVIHSKKDPKLLPDREIRRLIDAARDHAA